MVKRDQVQKPTENFLQWKRVDHRSSWKRSDWARNWSNPLCFDLHETLRFSQRQNLHLMDDSVQFDNKEKWGNTNDIMMTKRLWRPSLRYGFYDQEGKLQVVNYSADPKGVNYFACHHCFLIHLRFDRKKSETFPGIPCKGCHHCHHCFPWSWKSGNKSNKYDTFSGIPCRGWPCAKARILKNLKLSNFLFSVKMPRD